MTAPLRLDRAEIHCYALPYQRPVQWFDSVETEGLYVLLRLHGTHGESGVAEAPIRPSWSGVSVRSLVAALEDLLLPALQGLDLGDPDAVRSALDRFPENGLAKMLVDNACCALRADVRQQPLWALWQGRQAVDLSWCVTRQPPLAMAREAAAMVERHGFRTLKVKGGQGLADDLVALREIRAAIGPSVALTVDANCAYPTADALGYVQALAEAGAILAEDPCPLAPDAAFSRLATQAALPLLVDTACANARDAAAFLGQGASALSIKPGRIGFTESERIRQLADAAGARVSAGMYAESALGSLLSLQFASTLTHAVTAAEISFFLLLAQQVLREPLTVTDGQVHLPHAVPGADLVDWDSVRRHGRALA